MRLGEPRGSRAFQLSTAAYAREETEPSHDTSCTSRRCLAPLVQHERGLHEPGQHDDHAEHHEDEPPRRHLRQLLPHFGRLQSLRRSSGLIPPVVHLVQLDHAHHPHQPNNACVRVCACVCVCVCFFKKRRGFSSLSQKARARRGGSCGEEGRHTARAFVRGRENPSFLSRKERQLQRERERERLRCVCVCALKPQRAGAHHILSSEAPILAPQGLCTARRGRGSHGSVRRASSLEYIMEPFVIHFFEARGSQGDSPTGRCVRRIHTPCLLPRKGPRDARGVGEKDLAKPVRNLLVRPKTPDWVFGRCKILV